MNWTCAEYKIVDVFWKVVIVGMILWTIRCSSEIDKCIFTVLGLLWILHSFKMSIVGLYHNLIIKENNNE